MPIVRRTTPVATIILLTRFVFGVPSAAAGDTLTIVAPAAPGGGWDQTARALQQTLLRNEPGLNVQVENVPGAAGTIGLARFVTAERGNPNALLVTGLVMLSAIVINRAPVSLAETTPIARLTAEYEVIVVPAASPFHSMSELLDAFRRAPASISWGGGSAGGTDDVLVRLLAEAEGVPPTSANYIAFPGGGAALAAVLGGQVTAAVSGFAEFAGQVESGQLRLLAVSAPARVPGIEAPTLREAGVAVDLANWRAVVAPPGVSDRERDEWTRRIERMARSTAWQEAIRRNGWTDTYLTGAEFRQFLLAEQTRIEAVLHRLDRAGHSNSLRTTTITPITVPLAVLLTLGGLLIANVASFRAFKAPMSGDARGGRPANRAVLGLSAALLCQAFVLPLLGFVLTTTGVFTIVARTLGSRRAVRDLLLGLALAAAMYAIFTAALGLTLPADPISRWSA